ncbi:MAG: iron/manganese transporter, partial [Pseudonocardiales bacterium]|nr:iron/manganese transporter [Pseudonocardiales bacterium]
MTTMVRATPSDPTTRRRGQRNASGARLRALGPAVFVSAGYVDPGNWATDVAAGAKFGFSLIWVLAAATLAALFIQQLSARLGVASGEDLATLMHTRLGINVRRLIVPPVLCALVVTEIVEVLGVVIGIQLLTGWPAYQAIPAACLLVLVVVLAPRRFGRGVVYGCLGFVSLVYLVLLADHGLGDVAAGMRPTTLPPGGLPVAIGIVGAVIMPHNVLLHS